MKLIELSGPKSKGHFAKVDDEDVEKVTKYRWSLFKGATNRYAFNGHIETYMHRLIMNLKKGDGVVIDHKDGDGLNNQKSNLRLCTSSQNAMNRAAVNRSWKTPFRGVHKSEIGITWRAEIKHKGKLINLGCFKTAEEAHESFKKAAVQLRGEFARTD